MILDTDDLRPRFHERYVVVPKQRVSGKRSRDCGQSRGNRQINGGCSGRNFELLHQDFFPRVLVGNQTKGPLRRFLREVSER